MIVRVTIFCNFYYYNNITKECIIMYSLKEAKNKINFLKLELLQLAKETRNINTKKILDKSQELDELIVSFMKNQINYR